jgi:predicted metal-dependent peptidase
MLCNKQTAFFSALLASMRLVYDEEQGTAWTDGIHIGFAPSFIYEMDPDELMGLMLHELGHNIFEHVSRAELLNLDKFTLNVAGDHYINLWLTKWGFKLPKGGLCDHKYTGWSTMKIYEYLEKNPNKLPPRTGPGAFACDVKPAPGMTPQDVAQNIKSKILQAAVQADLQGQPGSVPGAVRQYIEEVTNPKLPWDVILANYVDEYRKDDYSLARPNRRYLPDYILPTLHVMGLNQVTFGCDVSGSMTGKLLSICKKEIDYIWQTLAPARARLQTFDTEVQHNKMYSAGDALDEVELVGGGGTNVIPLLESIEQEEPMLSIIFTDGCFEMPDMDKINTDIIWIIIGNWKFDPPGGKVIRMEEHPK